MASSENGGNDPREVGRLLRLLRLSASEVECQVRGGSMSSSIPDGATVRIRLDGAQGAAPQSAVALLLAGDTLSVHRLIRRGQSSRARGFVVTQGDGNAFCDPPQRETDLLGTVVALRRAGERDWVPVPPPGPLSLRRRAVTVAFERLMSAAMELSPFFGALIKNSLVLAITPFVLLRPYPPGQRRASSRLVAVRQVPSS